MCENKVKTICENGGAVINGWLHIPSPFSAEIMAQQGFDSLTIDMQHVPVHYDAALPMLQEISTTDTIPLARVPWNEAGIIMKMLDAACYGIICPMVNNIVLNVKQCIFSIFRGQRDKESGSSLLWNKLSQARQSISA